MAKKDRKPKFNTIDPSELEMTPCNWPGPHEAHIWSWSKDVERSSNIEFDRDVYRMRSDNRLCPGMKQTRTDEEKWEASKRAMVVLTWMWFAFFGVIWGIHWTLSSLF